MSNSNTSKQTEDKIVVSAKKLSKLKHDIGKLHRIATALERELLNIIILEGNNNEGKRD